MLSLPDIATVRLCSLLLSIAFAGVFLVIWRGRREDSYLLHWAASSAIYAAALAVSGFLEMTMGPASGGLIYAVITGSNVLLVTGQRVFDGLKPFRAWMAAFPFAGWLFFTIPGWLAEAGMALPSPASQRVGGTIVLMATVGIFGWLIARGGEAVPARRSRRIAGIALAAYVPTYVIAMALELEGPSLPHFAALLPMLSDQLLLAILYLGLLAMQGERASQALREAAMRDALTGAWNRAGLEAQRPAMLARGAALILLDIDHFKAVNDRHGHGAGDAVLASLSAQVAAIASEGGGALFRIGGDEFIALLPRTEQAQARQLAERMRIAISQDMPGLPPYTVSLGLAMVAPGEDSLTEAIARADQLLYVAKNEGRNRLVS